MSEAPTTSVAPSADLERMARLFLIVAGDVVSAKTFRRLKRRLREHAEYAASYSAQRSNVYPLYPRAERARSVAETEHGRGVAVVGAALAKVLKEED